MNFLKMIAFVQLFSACLIAWLGVGAMELAKDYMHLQIQKAEIRGAESVRILQKNMRELSEVEI